MAETGTASTITPSLSTAVTYALKPVAETSFAGQAYNGLTGYWVSDQLVMPGTPVTSSVIRWTTNIPAYGSTVTVQTSINNGLTWDTPTNNALIPRLAEGDTTTGAVLVKVSFTRLLPTDTPPELTMLYVAVTNDSSTDELLSIFSGIIDKVTVHAVAGTQGASGSGAVSSSAVKSHGGGQTGAGTSIKIHATDLSLAVKRNVWEQPYFVSSGITYGQAVEAMVRDRLPSQTAFRIATCNEIVPEIMIFGTSQGGDPWQDTRGVAQAVGFECFFDPDGVFVFQQVPDPRYGLPVYTLDENDVALVAEATRELGADQTFNDIVIIGQSSSSANAVSAEAMDLDPNSRTYVNGRFGRVSQRLTFPLIVTQSAAQAAANATLYNSIGGSDQVTLECVPHAGLVPGDVIKIVSSAVRADSTYMINSMTMSGCAADPQELVCFRQSVSNTN